MNRNKQQLRIDCHSHILPGMDDGAQDVHVSLEMLRLTGAYGVETVLLTPHYYPSLETPASFLARRERALDLLHSETDGNAFPRLFTGAEVRLEQEISLLPDLKNLCISNSDRLLLEMPYLPLSPWMVEEAENICYRHGAQLILAHLPRYMAYYDKDDFEELVSLPQVIVQVNAEDMLYRPSRKLVLDWVARGVPVLFGSDCHNLTSRRPNLDKAARYIGKSYRGICPAVKANTLAATLGWLEK